MPPSHLTALRNHHVQVRHVLAPVARLGRLHLLDHIEAVHHLAEDDVLAVEEGRRHRRDEELRAVAVGARVLRQSQEGQQEGRRRRKGLDLQEQEEENETYRHGQQTRLVVLERKVLVLKGLVAPDGRRAGAVGVEKVAALAHEVGDLPGGFSGVSRLCIQVHPRRGVHRDTEGRNARCGGTWSPCSPGAGRPSPWTRRCRTGGSFRPSWGRRP